MKLKTKFILLLGKGDRSYFDISAEEQKRFLESLSPPKDLIDRSYCQYKCQSIFMSKYKKIMLNLFSLIAIPLFILIALVRRLKNTKKESLDAIGHFFTMSEIIPNSLNERYVIDTKHWALGYSLSIKDVLYIKELIIRYPLSPYFIIKNLINIALYSKMIHSYNPKALICHAEFSFTSSILTDYCRMHNVKHINVMHGEKLYFIRDAYFEYDECYVWNEYYKNLLIDMRADSSQFIVQKPLALTFIPANYYDDRVYSDVKYYLANQTEEEFATIVESMSYIKGKGLSIKYRPHPTYTNKELLRKYIPESEIEWNSDVSILESLSNLEYAIGLYSTTLLQAKLIGKNVILDDITYYTKYEKLKELRYILLSSDYKALKLSDFVKL